MAQIIIEYDARSVAARKLIEFISSSGIAKIKTEKKTGLDEAIEEVENGDVVYCGSYENYLKDTKKHV